MEIKITTEYITLGQFLKYVGIIDNGAMAKEYLSNNKTYVNGEIDTRRGKKLYPGDVIKIKNSQYRIES